MKDELYPIVVATPIKRDNGIRFLLLDDQIDIEENENLLDIWKILEFSNGYNTITDISEAAKISRRKVFNIIKQLIDLKIIYDSRRLFSHFHEITKNPERFYRSLSAKEIIEYTESSRKAIKEGTLVTFNVKNDDDLSNIVFNRRSCRSFSRKLLTKDLIGNICMNAYCVTKHAVPSGGGLYPLKVYVLIEKDQIDIQKGYYEYDSEENCLIQFNYSVDEETLYYCFNDEEMPFGSSVQIIIAADLDRQTFKYSNRGYRLTLIEAGHVAENICLYCHKNDIGTCELGGVLEDALAQELELNDEKISPLLAIAIGYPSTEKRFDVFQFKNIIEDELIIQKKSVKFYKIDVFRELAPFFCVTSYYDKNFDCCAGGTSTSMAGAISKAIIEGYERKVSGISKFDYFGPAQDLTIDWLNPLKIRPLSNEQLSYNNLRMFNTSLSIHWTKGLYIKNNKTILVPSDLVFYGSLYISDKIAYADSSGVAAYTDMHTAIERALLELIERDAIMKNWYMKKSPRKISYDFLPIHVKKRIDFWSSHNRKVYVLDMESEFAPTVQVIIVGSEYPHFVTGAASGIYDIDKIVIKALREAECALVYGMQEGNREIKKEDVFSPEDHGTFYNMKEHYLELEWLWSSNKEVGLPSANTTMEDLIELLNPIIIDLTPTESTIKVVRVLSEKCLPISFGYKQDYYSHPLLNGYDLKNIDCIHYFA